MDTIILGLHIVIEHNPQDWQTRLIIKARKVAKLNNLDIEGRRPDRSWKIERIKAIRMIKNPYPYASTFKTDDNGQSTLTAAKAFVELYWM